MRLVYDYCPKNYYVNIVYVIESAAYGDFIHELFVSKTRTSEVRASEDFWHE